MTRRLPLLFLVVLSTPLGAPGLAAEPAKRELRNTFGVMVNVVGIEDSLDLSWRWRLSASKNPLVSDAHFSAGVTNTLSPAYDRIGVWLELSPLSIVDLRVGIEPTFYFGLFNSLQDFPGYDAAFDEKTRKDTNHASYAGFGGRAYFAPTLKLQLGHLIGTSSAEVEWWKAAGDGPYFYEPARDVLIESAGNRVLRTTSALLLEVPGSGGKRLLIGPMHQLVEVSRARRNRVQRVGLLGVWELGARRAGVGQPALIAQVAYYLDDRFKRHQLWALAAVRFTIGR